MKTTVYLETKNHKFDAGENSRMNRMLVIAVIIVSLVPLAVGQKQSPPEHPKENIAEVIRKLDHERIQAQIQADAAALNRLYADDFIGIGPSGAVRTKPQVLADFTSHDLKFQSITTSDVRIRVYGNTVVETGRSTMVGQDKGKVVPQENRFTRVWVKRQGRWQLVANHYSTLILQPRD
jgi:ketosteroid isomerase-like protein